MKLTKLYALTIVLLLFLTIQGWVVKEKFWSPKRVQAVEAVIMGETVEAKAPVPGVIQEIAAQEGARVKAGEPLVLLKPQGLRAITIKAPRDGVITNVAKTPGVFVQVNEAVATIVDANPDALHIRATLLVNPEDVYRIRPRLLATVHADYLNDGEPIQAMVTAVDPQYDAAERTIKVKLQLMDLPEDFAVTAIGLPVDLDFETKGEGLFARFFGNDTATATASASSTTSSK